MRSQNHPSKSARGARANFPSNFLSRCHLSMHALIYSRSGAAVGDEYIPAYNGQGWKWFSAAESARICTLDRMRGIEAKRDNAEKKAKVGEGERGGVVVRWRFSIDNQWSASAGLKVQRREIDLDSRYWLSQSDLVQGTPGTATVFAMQNREPPGLLADETGAHTPYVLFHRRNSPSLSRHDTWLRSII